MSKNVALNKSIEAVFGKFENDVNELIFEHSRDLKAVLIHGVSVKNKAKNRSARAALDVVVKMLVANRNIDLIMVKDVLKGFSKDEQKAMPNVKKAYNRMVDGKLRELKVIRRSLDAQLNK